MSMTSEGLACRIVRKKRGSHVRFPTTAGRTVRDRDGYRDVRLACTAFLARRGILFDAIYEAALLARFGERLKFRNAR